MAYASASDVAALCRNLANGGSTFDATTCPTGTQVNVWLTTGCAVINAHVSALGYTPPLTGDAGEVAQQANACYAAWFAERSRHNARTSADERTRAEMFKKDFDELMKVIAALDLGRLGAEQTSVAYAGGISVSDKETVESDTDRVSPRFFRGMFSNPEALTASDSAS